MNSHFLRFYFLILTSTLLVANMDGLHAQWREIGLVKAPTGYVNCGFFWTASKGVIGGDMALYYYDDGQWYPSIPPKSDTGAYFDGLDTSAYIVESIRSFDNNILYAAVSKPVDSLTSVPEAWQSLDSGRSWSIIPAKHYPDSMVYADDIYLLPDGLPTLTGYWHPPNYLSGSGMSTVARIDSMHLIAACDDGQSAYYSTDGGLSWNVSFNIRLQDGTSFGSGYSAYYDCASDKAYISGEGDTPYPMAESTDSGRTWSYHPSNLGQYMPYQTGVGDILNGGKGQLYIQDGPGFFGILHSSDGGFTWENIGGPPALTEDIRICVLGCQGKTVIAFGGWQPQVGTPDTCGIWLYDGGDFDNGDADLAFSPAQLQLGSLPACVDFDTFVVVKNSSCNNTTITGLNLTGTGFSLSPTTLPKILTPGENDTILLHVKADTTSQQLQNIASIRVQSECSEYSPTIPMSRTIFYRADWSLALSPKDSAYAGDTVIYDLIMSQPLPLDVDTLNFTLSVNDDVLTFLGSDNGNLYLLGSSQNSNGYRVLRFKWISTTDTEAHLRFRATLSKNETTDLLLDSIALGATAIFPCSNSPLSSISSLFSLRNACGDNEMRNELLGLPVLASAASPNPTSGKVSIVLSSRVNVDNIQFEVQDVMGRIWSPLLSSIENPSILDIDLSPLVPGIYYLVLSEGTMRKTVAVVKE
jgi:hypothetical protein